MEAISMAKKIFLFDFDGVLADSLRKHIVFCLMINEKYQKNLRLPTIDDTNGWRPFVSFPFEKFLVNLGFSPEEAKLIHDVDYLEEFGPRSDARLLFDGVAEMIIELHKAGNRLGIVSLNTLSNILNSLGPLANYFDVISSADQFETKVPALINACARMKVSAEDAVYVGDALADFRAANEVNMPFIGASYGWQITGQEEEFPSVASIDDLYRVLANL
jgi:HAD superfamily hydrolase (TIGR01549 family)